MRYWGPQSETQVTVLVIVFIWVVDPWALGTRLVITSYVAK